MAIWGNGWIVYRQWDGCQSQHKGKNLCQKKSAFLLTELLFPVNMLDSTNKTLFFLKCPSAKIQTNRYFANLDSIV